MLGFNNEVERPQIINKDQARALMPQRKEASNNEVYRTIRDECYRRISNRAKDGEDYCYYEIPRFHLGLPLYDPEIIFDYLYRELNAGNYQLLGWRDQLRLCIGWCDSEAIANVAQTVAQQQTQLALQRQQQAIQQQRELQEAHQRQLLRQHQLQQEEARQRGLQRVVEEQRRNALKAQHHHQLQEQQRQLQRRQHERDRANLPNEPPSTVDQHSGSGIESDVTTRATSDSPVRDPHNDSQTDSNNSPNQSPNNTNNANDDYQQRIISSMVDFSSESPTATTPSHPRPVSSDNGEYMG